MSESQPMVRTIRTARTEEEINRAAREGYFPLVKRVKQSKKIRSKFAILQSKTTGEIEVIGDFRGGSRLENAKMVIDFTSYYPHNWPSPYAAYLLPPDLKKGERVFLQDLIEDHVQARWNQGDAFRMQSCHATWNGEDFVLHPSDTIEEYFLG